jgi:hypothetical protein
VLVPIEDVEDVLPRRKRIVLEREPDLTGADFITQVRTRLRRLAAESAPSTGLRVVQPERG